MTENKGKSNAVFVILLVLAIGGIAYTVVTASGTRQRLGELQEENRVLAERVDALGNRTEVLVGERSRARLERNEQRRRAEEAGAALESSLSRLEAALADLERVSLERDDHLERRLYLTRRLSDTETALAVALRRIAEGPEGDD